MAQRSSAHRRTEPAMIANNGSNAPRVPAHRGVRREPRLHDKGVLTGVVIVPSPTTRHPEPEGLVETDGLAVTRANLEHDESQIARPRLGQDVAEESAGD